MRFLYYINPLEEVIHRILASVKSCSVRLQQTDQLPVSIENLVKKGKGKISQHYATLFARQYPITKYNYLTKGLSKRLFNFPLGSTAFRHASQNRWIV